jgi:drug/metabolite transporter (DMT)-like permease
VVSLFGAAVYGAEGVRQLVAGLPPRMWVLGAVTAVTQYGAVRLIRVALKWGPLSPLWCALTLAFIPVVGFSWLFLDEPLQANHLATLAAAIASVGFATAGQVSRESGAASPSAGTGATAPLAYGLALLALMTLNSTVGICLKLMNAWQTPAGESFAVVYRDGYFMMLYGGLIALAGADMLLRRLRPRSLRWMLAAGVLGGAGSTAGLWFLVAAMALPAAVVFVLNSMVSLSVTALIGTFVFGERRTLTWYGTVGCALLAVLASQFPALVRLAGG